MQNVGLGDVFFILLILGVIHGIMSLIGWQRKRSKLMAEARKDE